MYKITTEIKRLSFFLIFISPWRPKVCYTETLELGLRPFPLHTLFRRKCHLKLSPGQWVPPKLSPRPVLDRSQRAASAGATI